MPDDTISYLPPAPNPMFPAEVAAFTRFVVFPASMPLPACPVCGKVGGVDEDDEDDEDDEAESEGEYWTMTIPFMAGITTGLVLDKSGPLAALTPVCEDHPLLPVPEVHQQVLDSCWHLVELWAADNEMRARLAEILKRD